MSVEISLLQKLTLHEEDDGIPYRRPKRRFLNFDDIQCTSNGKFLVAIVYHLPKGDIVATRLNETVWKLNRDGYIFRMRESANSPWLNEADKHSPFTLFCDDTPVRPREGLTDLVYSKSVPRDPVPQTMEMRLSPNNGGSCGFESFMFSIFAQHDVRDVFVDALRTRGTFSTFVNVLQTFGLKEQIDGMQLWADMKGESHGLSYEMCALNLYGVLAKFINDPSLFSYNANGIPSKAFISVVPFVRAGNDEIMMHVNGYDLVGVKYSMNHVTHSVAIGNVSGDEWVLHTADLPFSSPVSWMFSLKRDTMSSWLNEKSIGGLNMKYEHEGTTVTVAPTSALRMPMTYLVYKRTSTGPKYVEFIKDALLGSKVYYQNKSEYNKAGTKSLLMSQPPEFFEDIRKLLRESKNITHITEETLVPLMRNLATIVGSGDKPGSGCVYIENLPSRFFVWDTTHKNVYMIALANPLFSDVYIRVNGLFRFWHIHNKRKNWNEMYTLYIQSLESLFGKKERWVLD